MEMLPGEVFEHRSEVFQIPTRRTSRTSRIGTSMEENNNNHHQEKGRISSGTMTNKTKSLGIMALVSVSVIIIFLASNTVSSRTALFGEREQIQNQDSSSSSNRLDLIEPHQHRRLDEEFNEDGQQDEFHYYESLLPLSWSHVLGYVLATLGLMIAAGGGIGGGGILVPIYILVMGFDPKQAIPLSNVTVFGGAVANTILNVPKRHPLADRPLIDWDLILVMEPLTIAGALIGTHLNELLSPLIIVIMLVVLLSVTAHKTLQKAWKMYEKESLERNEANCYHLENDDVEMAKIQTTGSAPKNRTTPQGRHQWSEEAAKQKQPRGENSLRQLNPNTTNSPTDTNTRPENGLAHAHDHSNGKVENSLEDHCVDQIWDNVPADSYRDENFVLEKPDVDPSTSRNKRIGYSDHNSESRSPGALAALLEDERTSPKTNIAIVVTLFFIVLFINVMKGGGAFQSPLGIQCGSLQFWIAEASILICILLVSFYARIYLVGRTQEKDKLGYKYVEGDIHWDERTTVIYPTICTLAGFVAGLFGIGGGIIKGPLMLAMEVHPAVASATSACMILFTSSTATTSFAVFGLLIPDYAVVCFVVGFVATLVGQNVMAYLLQRYQRNSYIAFSVGIVVLLSAIFMTMESANSIRNMEIHSNEHHIETGLCGAHFD